MQRMSRGLYTLLIYLLLPFTPIKLLWRGLRQPAYWQHWGERYGIAYPRLSGPVIWLHCVSVGETRAAQPLIEALLKRYPQHQIFITHATPTGRDTSTQLFGDRVQRCYLPYDTPCMMRRFLQQVSPKIGILLETELWFNLLHAAQTQGVPMVLLNARLSERSAQGYRRLEGLMRQAMQQLQIIAPQTEDDAQRFARFGAEHLPVMGNIKFDVTPPENALALGQQLRQPFGNRPVFLAASTRDDEEQIIWAQVLKARIPNLLTIFVPRHPQRFDVVADGLQQQGVAVVRRSQLANASANALAEAEVLLGDSMGEMFAYYAACDVALIGGSLKPLGGQNLIEACAMGKPVLVGPHTYNFDDVTKQAIIAGAAKRIHEETLAKSLQDLFADNAQQREMGQAGLAFVKRSQGACERALAVLESLLK